jgi:hypothetical protein
MNNYIRASDNQPSRLIGINELTPLHLHQYDITDKHIASPIVLQDEDSDGIDLFCYEVMSD